MIERHDQHYAEVLSMNDLLCDIEHGLLQEDKKCSDFGLPSPRTDL